MKNIDITGTGLSRREYDMCINTPEDQLKDIMKKTEEEPSRFKGLEDVKRLIKEQEERLSKNRILDINN
jgi:hypothetical protein